jgi:regulator of protease activity HflC (stomatin/prohibitin superfamily)
MLTFVLIVLGIAIAAFMAVEHSNGYWRFKKSAVFAPFVFLLFIIIASTFTIIDSQHYGLRESWGSLSDETLDSGIHFKLPLKDRIITIPKVSQTMDIVIPVNENGAITKDNQTVGATLQVTYRYDKESLPMMYKNFGTEQIEKIINKSAERNFKTAIGQYTIFEVAENQGKINKPIEDNIREEAINDTSSSVVIEIVGVQNYDWTDEFDARIKDTMVQAQQVELKKQEVRQKEQEKLAAEQEVQKLVKKAEADKAVTILAAEATKAAAQLNAEAKALEGEGIKKYNDAIASNFEQTIRTKQLDIEANRVEKWNGQYVPNNMYGPIPVNTQGGVQGNQ